jgi:hypothetical protein
VVGQLGEDQQPEGQVAGLLGDQCGLDGLQQAVVVGELNGDVLALVQSPRIVICSSR